MDPTRRNNQIPATFEEFDAAMAMDASQMQGGVAGGVGGAAGIGTPSPAPPQPYVTEETRLPRNDFVSRAPYSSPAARLLHRRASSDVMGLAAGHGGEGDLFSRFAAGVEEVNNSAFVNSSRHMARAAGLLPPRPRPRHHHSQSMDASSSSLQAQRLLGLPATAAASSSSLQPQRQQLGLPLPATTIAQASSVLRAQDWLLGLPETTTTQASHGLGLPAMAASTSRQPQMLQFGGWPATAQASAGSLHGQATAQAQRLPELPATATPSSSGQPQRPQLGGSPAPATAQASAGSLLGQARLLDLRAAAAPSSSSAQPRRLQLGGLPATRTTTPSSSGPAERLKLGSPAKGKAKATAAGPSKLEIRKAMLAVEFEQIAINDPVRARRMLANRQSAARSKERKARYVAELEQKAQAMESDVATLSTNVALWQRKRDMLTAEKNELMACIENAEQHTQSQDAMTESLKLEIQYLQNFGGLPQPHGRDQLMHHQMDWMQQLQMPPPHQLPQSSHQAPLHHQGAQQQQQEAQPNLRMKEPMDASTCGQMDDGDSTGSEGNGN